MLWFFLNLLILGAILALIFNLNFRFEPNSPFFGGATGKLEAISRLISEETSEKTREERDAVLKRYSEVYGAEFFLFTNDGKQIGGREIVLPEELKSQLPDKDMPFPPRLGNERPPMPPRGARFPGRELPPPIFARTQEPTLYWFGLRTMTFEKDLREPQRSRLLVASDSFYGRGLFFDPMPLIVISAVVIGVSLIFWFPFVRGMTKTVGQMTDAAAKIANEDFEVRVNEKRTDELGKLGGSINYLAKRLSGFVNGQKRFLGDISHELNSPLARMQFALGILEERVDEKNLAYVQDVKEEVELMTKLVGELLTYSKAGIKATTVQLEQFNLKALVERVVERETANENVEITLDIEESLTVSAQNELLSRAVANVVRNAVRYAGDDGAINISAKEIENDQLKLSISDNGAGVPEHTLEKLFDPFFRVETHRSRQTGGTGLGLAIVKTCIEACGGKVYAENLTPKGFAVNIILQKS